MTDEQIKENIRKDIENVIPGQQLSKFQGYENLGGKELKLLYNRFLYYARKYKKEHPDKVYTDINDGSNELATLNELASAIQSEEWTTEGLNHILHKMDEVKTLIERKIQSNKEKEIKEAKKDAEDAIQHLNKLTGANYSLSKGE